MDRLHHHTCRLPAAAPEPVPTTPIPQSEIFFWRSIAYELAAQLDQFGHPGALTYCQGADQLIRGLRAEAQREGWPDETVLQSLEIDREGK